MEPEVNLTTKIRGYLEDAVSVIDNNTAEFKEIENILKNPSLQHIKFQLVKYVFDITKMQASSDDRKIYLNELLDGSKLYLPNVEPSPRNPELEVRIEKLKAQQANREYKRMVRNVDKSQHVHTESIAKEVKALNTHVWSMINFLVTVGGAFAFGYKATEYAFTGTGAGNKFAFQLVNGLILATIVFFADLYFLVKYS